MITSDVMDTIISAANLVKRYGEVTAVAGIDFEVRPGECFGLLGPNGAGKTSTIRMITCVSPVTAGELRVAGHDVRADARQVRALLGIVPQDDNLDPDLSVFQNLLVYSRYYDIPRQVALARIEEDLNFMQLQEKRDAAVESLSGGMKRRLAIARALINRPRIMVLDEPTTGLDPQARHMVWQKLRQLKAQGVTMILSTHYMEEASRLCDRLIILDQGRILAEGRPVDLIEWHAGREVIELHLAPERREAVLAEVAGLAGITVETVEDTLYVFSQDSYRLPPLLDVAREDEQVVRRRATLEDVFLRLTGRGLRE